MDKEIEILSDGGSIAEHDTCCIYIGDKEYEVKIADTEETRETGLQGVESLGEDEGMLFVFDEPVRAAFWMKDTLIPLDIIYINEDGEVVEVHANCIPMDDTLLEAESDDIKYVLELNSGSKVKVGDDIDLGDLWGDGDFDDDDEEEVVMSVLDANGESQMDLKGGERIFSRPNTKTLVSLAKRAWKSKTERDYKALGKRVFKYLHVQNTKEEDYVDLPE